jgi:hypothetical protein
MTPLSSDAMMRAIHESHSRDEPVIGVSDRSFGIVMGAALVLVESDLFTLFTPRPEKP